MVLIDVPAGDWTNCHKIFWHMPKIIRVKLREVAWLFNTNTTNNWCILGSFATIHINISLKISYQTTLNRSEYFICMPHCGLFLYLCHWILLGKKLFTKVQNDNKKESEKPLKYFFNCHILCFSLYICFGSMKNLWVWFNGQFEKYFMVLII